MKVYLRFPERQEIGVNLNLIPKAGENLDYQGSRYVVVNVVHTVDNNRTVLEIVKISEEDGFRTIRMNDLARYRTSEIRSHSPTVRPIWRG
jgi:hypothetical protein